MKTTHQTVFVDFYDPKKPGQGTGIRLGSTAVMSNPDFDLTAGLKVLAVASNGRMTSAVVDLSCNLVEAFEEWLEAVSKGKTGLTTKGLVKWEPKWSNRDFPDWDAITSTFGHNTGKKWSIRVE